MHLLEYESPGLAVRIEALTPANRREAIAKAASALGEHLTDLEPRILQLLDVVGRDNSLSTEQVAEAKAYADDADARYFALEEQGGDEFVRRNWFAKARLATAIANGFGGASWQDAADALYELCFTLDDKAAAIALVSEQVDAMSKSKCSRTESRRPAMRLCRFTLDEMNLTGFFADDRVIPIHQAADAYEEQTGREILLPATDDLLDLLPPDGEAHDAARVLADWVERLDPVTLDGIEVPLGEIALLVPIPDPGKILLLAGNYAKHVAERGGTAAERDETFPYVFMKPNTTLTHPGGPVVIPRVSPDHVDWECELGVVIGRVCRDVAEADALGYVAGYTVVNDISDRKFTPNPGRKIRERDKFFDWQHGKWHDTFCPVGPCVLSAHHAIDPQTFPIRLTVNGEVKQDATTAQMVFPVAAVVSFLSRFVTLQPGDIVSTGTPSGVGSATGTYLKPGDVVRASVGGIGTLENPVTAEGD